jgi:hypothetical protein
MPELPNVMKFNLEGGIWQKRESLLQMQCSYGPARTMGPRLLTLIVNELTHRNEKPREIATVCHNNR